jgi:rhodanese-related sulfurtransferase
MKKFIVFLLLVACSQTKTETSLAPADFSSKFKGTPNAILLDVRTAAEVSEGAITGARNIVYDDSFAGKLANLPTDVPIFVYCAAGKRSAKAAEILKEKGYKEVYQLKGGLDAWREAKLPL